MNESQLDQLRATLRRESSSIQPVGLGAETVRRRGRRRRNRGRTLVAVGAATCVAGVGASIAERGSGGTPQQVAVGSQAGAVATPSLEFRAVTGTVSNDMAHFTTAAGVTYELSTAPGTAGQATDPGQAIYSTSDGEHWTTATQDKSWISDLTEHNGVLYAIGTAPGASASDVQYRIATSHDGGNAWSDENLPFDLSIPTASVPISRASSVQVASGATATVAVMTEYFSPDISALVAAAAAGRPDVTSRETSTGFDVVDMSGCTGKLATGAAPPNVADIKARAAGQCADAPVLRKITWSELGLSGLGDLTHQEMLVSTDGTHWSPTPAPTAGSVTNLVATNNGFLLLAQSSDPTFGAQPSTPTTTLLHSTDAHTWTNVATPAGLNVQAIAADDIVGIDYASGAVQTSTDGGATWNTTAVNAVLPAGTPAETPTMADAGPLGFAVLVTPNTPTPGHDSLLFSTDGITWTTTNLSTVGEPATAYPMQVTVGADHVSVDYEANATTAGAPAKMTTLLGTPKR